MTIDTIAARNETIRELRAEIERLRNALAEVTLKLGSKAEAAEARVAELERELVEERQWRGECAVAVIARDEARAKLALADRLAEALRAARVQLRKAGYMNITRKAFDKLMNRIDEALAAYEAGEGESDG